CCSRSDVDWMFVGGRAVVHLVNIVDPDHVLPQADDFDSACDHLDHLMCRRYPLPGADVHGSGLKLTSAGGRP
ncbi:MAG: hypothetical protein QOI28_3857, partial [Mycobacterium sp.]|nr:hypothetical protein [Mycobacterium sp.]